MYSWHGWFDENCMPKVLIDDDNLSDSEESGDNYEDDFAINEKSPRNLWKTIQIMDPLWNNISNKFWSGNFGHRWPFCWV